MVHSFLTSALDRNVSDQLLAMATLPLVPTEQHAGWAPELDWKVLRKIKFFYLCQEMNVWSSSLQIGAIRTMPPGSWPYLYPN